MGYETIRFEKKDSLATITLNRPKSLNALDIKLCQELMSAISRAGRDKEIRAVVVTAEGKAFCAGGDISLISRFMQASPEDNPAKIIEEIVTVFHPIILAIRGLKKPVIGAINGFCSGGGAGIALACDILIASEEAKIHMAYTRIGEALDGGNSFFLIQTLGYHRAAELALSGGSLDAHEAYRMGLFNRVVKAENLLEEANKLAGSLAEGPVFAMGKVKHLLNTALSGNLQTQLDEEKEAVTCCAETGEFKEGIKAFLEKRRPLFTGLS